MSNTKHETHTAGKEKKSNLNIPLAVIVIPVLYVVSLLVYMYVFGNPANFEGGDNTKHPLPGNYMGTIYKGGVIVPVLLTLFLTVITFSIERWLTISKAAGKGSIETFLRQIKTHLATNNVHAAIHECDKYKGSIANVVRGTLVKYGELVADHTISKDQKLVSLQKEVEEGTSLELPMLEKNLVILATIASVATLVGLLGTVMGMIKAFAAIATSGAPDSVALSTGISEALINTALGIGSSTIAIIMYNVFTTRIDKLTYGIDEAGFSIIQSFAANNK